MSRPTDWAPLATSDPLPGDPDRVVAVARRNGDLAEQLTEQARKLRELATSEGWDSDAGRVFAGSAQDLAGRLEQARRRYSVVAEALGGYAPKLRQAQQEADVARLSARDAQQRIDANAPTPTLAAVTPDQVSVERQRQAAYEAASQDLTQARRRLDGATRDRDAAATTAAHRIKDVIEHDGLQDGFWDKVKDWTADRWNGFIDWVHEHAAAIKFIADVAGMLATVISVVAIAISFIPVLNFLTPILLGIAVGLTAIALVCHLMLALSGDGSWLEVGLDVFALVTFGYGRVAARGLSAARGLLQTSARRAVTTATRRAAAARTRDLSRQLASRTTSTAARRGAGKALAGIKTQARRSAARTVSRLGEEELPVWKRLVFGDGEFAGVAGGTRAIVHHVENLGGVAARDVTKVRAAGEAVNQQVRTMAGVGAAALGVDLADRETNLPLPDGTVVDLDGPLPDKGSLLEPVKERTRWGRYANGG